MDIREQAIAQFNAQAEAKGWLQYCDPANDFVMRECEELIELWNWARGDRDLPARDDLPARTLKPYLPRLSLVERIENDPPRFKFRLVGTVMTRSLSERTGQAFDHESATQEQTDRWTESTLLSLTVKQPLRFPTVVQRHMVGEMLLLPLADETGEPRFVIAYGRYEPTRDWSVREASVRAQVGA
ncbi:MAG: PAS domain-containing protein [Rhizomicrobium sp.]